MLKNILKLEGAKELKAQEQKQVKGASKLCWTQCGPTGGVPSNSNPAICWCY